MVITTLESYSLKALVYIVLKNNKKASVSEISQNIGISFPYILRICSTLREKGILSSEKGRKGGYTLKREPSTISLYEIFKAFNKESIEIKCDFGKNIDAHCFQKDCILIPEWKKVKAKFDNLMQSITLSDFTKGGAGDNPADKNN